MRFAIVTLVTLFTAAHGQEGGSLESVLRSNGRAAFADFVRTAAPQLFTIAGERNDLTVFAPETGNSDATNPRLVKRTPEDQARAAAMFTWSGKPPPPPPKNRKRQQDELPDSNFEVLQTLMSDPAFINIGAGEHLKYVSNYASPKGGSGDLGADIEITTGLGRKVNTSGEAIKYAGGVIYRVDGYFTLPGSLTATLEDAGLTVFLDAIKAAGVQNKLDTTPRITVFAPLNALASNSTVEGQVIENFLGFTPDLDPGHTYPTTGGSITVTKSGAQWFANGAKIVRADVAIKNGVAHYIDNVNPTANAPTPTSVQPFTGSSWQVTRSIGLAALGAFGVIAWTL